MGIFSVKDKFSALKNDIVLSIEPPYKINWISKTQKGAKNDKHIFDEGLLSYMSGNEVMITDSG
jgi:hypothetical protein